MRPIATFLPNIFKVDKERRSFQKKMEQILGFSPSDYSYYEQALLHSSAINGSAKGQKHNERLEFLGDSVLDTIVADLLFKKFPEKDEGELTKLRAQIVNRVQLNRVASEIGLDKLIIGKFSNNIQPEDVKGNALEAIIGAIFLDRGFSCAYKFVERCIFEPCFKAKENITDARDYKSELFIWAQKQKAELLFEMVSDTGRGNSKKYVINLRVNGKILGTGEGNSKKKAQQTASKNAFKKLNLA